MKNGLKYGLFIAILSLIWIVLMHLSGYDAKNVVNTQYSWLEYTSILIPFLGLYLGIKAFRKSNGGSLTFFEGIFEGFKIILIGGVLAAAFSFLYLNIFSQQITSEYMERTFAAIVIGILFTLVNALLLMTTPKQL